MRVCLGQGFFLGFHRGANANSHFHVIVFSYFLAETVKYAYLLALDHDPIPMSSFILNTEAHPLPIFEWRDWEKKRYDIKP